MNANVVRELAGALLIAAAVVVWLIVVLWLGVNGQGFLCTVAALAIPTGAAGVALSRWDPVERETRRNLRAAADRQRELLRTNPDAAIRER